MTFDDIVYTKTIADPTIAGIIAGGMWPDKLPQKPTYPLIVYSVSSEDDGDYRAHDSTPTERMVTFVQFSCYSNRDQPKVARALADAVSAFWSGLQDLPNIGYSFAQNRFSNPNDALNACRAIVEAEIEHARTLT